MWQLLAVILCVSVTKFDSSGYTILQQCRSDGPTKGCTDNSGTKLKTTTMYKTSMCDKLSLALLWGFSHHTLTNTHTQYICIPQRRTHMIKKIQLVIELAIHLWLIYASPLQQELMSAHKLLITIIIHTDIEYMTSESITHGSVYKVGSNVLQEWTTLAHRANHEKR